VGVHVIRSEFIVPRPRDAVFAFHADARNLERITPPWLQFHILTPTPVVMRPGTLIDYRLRLKGLPITWQSEITVWDAPHRFVDVQRRGPYRLWEHTHEFEDVKGGTRVRDSVRYALPLGLLGDLVRLLVVKRDVETIFAYRERAMLALLTA